MKAGKGELKDARLEGREEAGSLGRGHGMESETPVHG